MKARLNLERYIDLLVVLIYKEWVVKYKRTILGFIWSIIYPLILALAFYIAFKFALKLPTKNFSILIIPAVFVWQWISNSLLISQWTFISNAVIIKKYPIPKWILVLANNLIDTIHFLLATPIIILFILFFAKIKYNLILFIMGYLLLLAIQLVFNFSISLILATLNVFFRDIDRLLLVSLNILIFITPIFYSINSIPKNHKLLFYLNPFTPFIEAWRSLFLTGMLNYNLLICIFYTILIFFLAVYTYRKLGYLVAEVV